MSNTFNVTSQQEVVTAIKNLMNTTDPFFGSIVFRTKVVRITYMPTIRMFTCDALRQECGEHQVIDGKSLPVSNSITVVSNAVIRELFS